MDKPDKRPETLCMAPWMHTYLSPQTERRLCCSSREPAQSFTQYIDSAGADGVYNPMTLEEWWNSDHLKSVRKRMMAGETLPECEVCNTKLLNTDLYRSYFDWMGGHKYDQLWDATDETGHTTMKPTSWDYRFSNICNFKCRMCGEMLSSSWESETRNNAPHDMDHPSKSWMLPDNKQKITDFHKENVEQEFSDAVEEHRIEEVYWVGGEPLMYPEHWKYMSRIIELGDGDKVYARYNTNLSKLTYKGMHLFSNVLDHVKDWQICASIDGAGKIGEYIRTGLIYDKWLDNFKEAATHKRHARQLKLDVTITTPGLFEMKNMFDLSQELDVQIMGKVCFAFTPDVLMSPMCLPRHILNPIVQDIIDYCKPKANISNQSFIDVLEFMLERPNFEEQWPDQPEGLIRGKKRILMLERIRKDCYTMENILEENSHESLKWYRDIKTEG
tara:strand:+ start:334 stop:1665 length:1332 start_codon:yes stop_codon:yes gene_type:complete